MYRGEKRLEIAAFWFVVLALIIGLSAATFAQETSACTVTVQPGESKINNPAASGRGMNGSKSSVSYRGKPRGMHP